MASASRAVRASAVVIDRVFPLQEAREALRLLEDREVFGKVVVAP
jgi:alcohol dehydrogenase